MPHVIFSSPTSGERAAGALIRQASILVGVTHRGGRSCRPAAPLGEMAGAAHTLKPRLARSL
jgi:hypothetical protein